MITPILAKHGLYCIQPVQSDDAGVHLETNIIFAATAEKMVSTMPLILDKQTAQGMGSAITYARRYAYVPSLILPLMTTMMATQPASQSLNKKECQVVWLMIRMCRTTLSQRLRC